MKKFLALFCLIAGVASAEMTVVPFKQPEKFPLNFRLVLPKEDSTVVSHKPEDGFDKITVRRDDDRGSGMLVEAVDAAGKRLWHHDFGYNASATPGCSVSVSFHPDLMAVIVSYDGYKWDHSRKLLFVEKSTSGYAIREYSEDAPEIQTYIEKLPNYSKGFKYWIHPSKFVDRSVEFECIPGNPPERQSVHPFAQDARWFNVTASLDHDFKIIPNAVKGSH